MELTQCNLLSRRLTMRGRSTRMATKEPIPSARTKYIHVRSAGAWHRIHLLYSVPDEMFQSDTTTARCSS